MNYFDLHCDTPYRMYGEKQGFDKNELHVSLERASYFGHYAQLAAYGHMGREDLDIPWEKRDIAPGLAKLLN